MLTLIWSESKDTLLELKDQKIPFAVCAVVRFIITVVYDTLKQEKFIVVTRPAEIIYEDALRVAAVIPNINWHSCICNVKFLSFLFIKPAK